MNCTYCGFFNEEETEVCGRCDAQMPKPCCSECGCVVPWGDAMCTRCERLTRSADKTPCPSCSAANSVSAEYCTSCGTPMAVITRIMTLSRAREREPLETWRVYGIETRMVGRQRELARLYAQYRETLKTKRPRIASVTAPIGLGKSRLFAELQRQLDEEFSATHVLQAASRDEMGGPYSMFGRLLKDRFYIAEKEHPDSARRKLLEAVEAIIGDRSERIAHLVGQLMDIHFDDSPYLPTVRDSEGAHELDRRSFDALVELFSADSARNPLVIILEDLQFATNRSLDLIEYLTRHLSECAVLFVLSWDPEEIVSERVLFDLDYDEEIELTPLSDEEVETFVMDTLRKATDVPRELVERIVDCAHGNPLSVEELLRMLLSQGIIDTRQADWIVHSHRLDEIEWPETMEGAVHARLNTLSADERVVLEMASCIGTVFWPELVRCLYHLHEEHRRDEQLDWTHVSVDERLDELLESLERKDMVRRHDDSLVPDTEEMCFKHRIERAALYETLSSQHKQRHHRLIAQWLARRFADEPEQISQLVASHFDKARCLDHAARWYLRAAEDARARYANDEAVELFVRGLSYLSDADIDLKLQAFHDLGSLYDLLGEYDQALAYFREMLRYSWIINDGGKGGAAHNKIGRAYRSLGEYDLALEHLEQALELFRSVEDEPGVASTLDDIGKIYWIRGNFDEAMRYYSAGLHLRRATGNRRSIALSLNHLGSLKLQRGELRDAMVFFREALELRRAVDDKAGVVHSFNNLGILCLERGEIDQAITLFEEALDLARQIGYRGSLGVVLNNLGEAHLNKGDTATARAYLDEAIRVSEDSGEKRVMFDVLRNLGKIALKESDRKLALERVNEALAIANQLDSQLLLGVGMQSLADVHAQHIFDAELKSESLELAHECFKDAIAILEEVGNEGELGRCLSSYGQFLLEQDDVERGRLYLEKAREIFRRLEMRKMWDATERVIGGI